MTPTIGVGGPTGIVPLVIAMLVIGAAIAACSEDAISMPSVAVTGVVHAGPTCPAQHDPPAGGCEDRPVGGAILIVLDATGAEIARASTGPDGAFSVLLEAGSYSIVPQPVEGLLGTAPPVAIVVGGNAVQLDISYDTGIR